MKIVIRRDEFLDAFSAVAPAIPKQSPLVAIQSAFLRVTPEGTTLTASNLELAVTRVVSGVTVVEDGSVLLSERFHQVLRNGESEELTLTTDGPSLIVTGRGSRHVLPLADVATYPQVPSFQAQTYWRVAAADLGRGLDLTVVATTEKSTNYALNGVRFEFGDGTLSLAGYDGRRLALFDLAAIAEGEPVRGPASVPARAIRLLARIIREDSTAVDVAMEGNRSISFRCDGSEFWTRLCEGAFPSYAGASNFTWDRRAIFRVGDLKKAIQEAAVMTGEESRALSFRLDGGRLQVSARTAEVGSSEVDREVTWEGEARQVSLDFRHALDPLAVLDADEEVSVGVIGDAQPVLFEAGYSRHYVAPITIQKKGA